MNVLESQPRVRVHGLLRELLMKAIMLVLLSACGDSAPPVCHGACEAADGTTCQSDCDCASGKCLGGSCAEPASATVSCGSDSECAPDTCATYGDRCQGHACAVTADCPALESCEGSICVLHFCI